MGFAFIADNTCSPGRPGPFRWPGRDAEPFPACGEIAAAGAGTGWLGPADLGIARISLGATGLAYRVPGRTGQASRCPGWPALEPGTRARPARERPGCRAARWPRAAPPPGPPVRRTRAAPGRPARPAPGTPR